MVCSAAEKDFAFWIPIDIVKSEKDPARAGRETEWRIGGIASDEDASDLQGERVFVDGLDISYLLQRGAFNWDHGKDPGDILGEIDTAAKRGKQLYVEGFLYPEVKKASEVYNLIKSLKASGSKRKLGLSIEGKVKERDGETGKAIKKAWVKNVAITYNPINQGTFIDFLKSLGNFTFESCKGECSKCTACDVGKSVSSEGSKDQTGQLTEGVVKAVSVQKSQEELKEGVKPELQKNITSAEDTAKVLPSEESNKALSAGYDAPATSGGVSGSAVREESLDKEKKVTTFTKDHLDLKKKRKGTFTKSELVEWIQDKIGYPAGMANLMSDLIFKAIEVKGYMRTHRGHLERVKPFTRELTHELYRVRTMSDNALITRARKITQPDKLLHFYHAAKQAGKQELSGYIRSQGHRLGLTDVDFTGVSGPVGQGLKDAERYFS